MTALLASGLFVLMVTNAAPIQERAALVSTAGSAPADPLRHVARLRIHNVSLLTALIELQERSEVSLVFSPSRLPKVEVSCDCSSLTVQEALDLLLAGTGLRVKLIGRHVLVAPADEKPVDGLADELRLANVDRSAGSDQASFRNTLASSRAQGGRVSGRVLNELERPLAAVQLSIVGTTASVRTDAEGRFAFTDLTAPTVTLRAIFIGYRPVTQEATRGDTAVRIVMVRSPHQLDDLVVTGTPGEAQRRTIGNAVTRLDAVEAREIGAASDVGEMLNGRAPGVVVIPNTGRAGGGPALTIRGRSSLTLAGEPLVYVDGVRIASDPGTGPRTQGNQIASRLSDLNPEDIQTIEVLRGPAAATMYGSEAANGVIQIITKRGAEGRRPRVEISVRQGADRFLNAADRIGDIYGKHPTTGALTTWNPIRAEAARGAPIFGTGYSASYNVALSGRTSSTTSSVPLNYYLSTGYERANGIDPINWGWRLTARGNIGVTLARKLDLEASFTGIRSNFHLGQDATSRGSVLFGAVYGSIANLFPAAGAPDRRGFFRAPPEVLNSGIYDNVQGIDRFTSTLQIKHNVFKSLSHRLILGLDQTAEDNLALTTFMPQSAAVFFPANEQKGAYDNLRREIAQITVDYSAVFEQKLFKNLESNSAIGAQLYRREQDGAASSGVDFPGPGVVAPGTAATNRVDIVPPFINTTLGLYLQQRFGWRGRAYLTGAVRVDNNSAFGTNFDLAVYPKISATWVVADASGTPLPGFDELKLRGAFGASGRQPEAFSALRAFVATTGPGGVPAVTPAVVGNPDLKPERGRELELGFDASLWGRLRLDFTYYNRRTSDVILARSVAPSLGFPGSQPVNAGTTKNSGFELSTDLRLLETRHLRLDVSGLLALSRDKILDLDGTDAILVNNLNQEHRVGRPIGALYARRIVSAELDANGRAVNLQCLAQESGTTTMACAQAPSVFIGSITPKYSGAFTARITWRQWLQVYGMVDFTGEHYQLWVDALNRCQSILNCEVNHAPERFDARYVASIQNSGTPFREALIQNAAFARLREVSVSITARRSWVRLFGAQNGRLTFAGRNLHTWTKWPGMDPETRATARTNEIFSQAVLPPTAQFVVSASLSY